MINNKLLLEVIEILKENNLTIGAVESFTGGLFSSALTSISGVSKVFKGSIVSYSTLIKESVVKVNKETIENETVVSQKVAEEMAYNGSKILDTDITVSFTGNAGPTVCDGDKPVGLIFISIYFKENFYTQKCCLNLDRNAIRETAVNVALENILKIFGNFFEKGTLLIM